MADLESAAAASLVSEQEREIVVVIENVGRSGEEEDLEEDDQDGNVAFEEDEDIRPVRRSFSMSSSHQERVSIAEVLQMGIEDELMKKQGNGGENCKGGGRSCRQHCVVCPVRMKRSLSIGRNHFASQGREKNSLLPV
ncbi:hypothetical protein HPP92_014616 [Vanilla planifolia]|nr:hypothetical protein HPP92_014616 [Vanilla planifolia]